MKTPAVMRVFCYCYMEVAYLIKNPVVMRRILSECSGAGAYLINSSIHKGWSYCIVTDKGSNVYKMVSMQEGSCIFGYTQLNKYQITCAMN